MPSSHSRRRFRDIAALVDMTEDESEFTATTSMVQSMNVNTASSPNTSLENAFSLSFENQLQLQRQRQSIHNGIPHQPFVDETELYEDEEEDDLVAKPHLSAYLLQQQEKNFPRKIPFSNTNVALDGVCEHGVKVNEHNDDSSTSSSSDSSCPGTHDFDDIQDQQIETKSQGARSSGEKSMEADAGELWGGSTAQRFGFSSKRIQRGSLFGNNNSSSSSSRSLSINDRLRSRFGKQAEHDESQPQPQPSHQTSSASYRVQINVDDSETPSATANSNSDSDSDSNPNPVDEPETSLSKLRQRYPRKALGVVPPMKQPHELVLNSTDSTASCTTEGRSTASPSRDSIGTQMMMEDDDSRNASSSSHMSYHSSSSHHSSSSSFYPEEEDRPMDELPPNDSETEHTDYTESTEDAIEVIPAWKLKQRQKMRASMKLPSESQSLLDTEEEEEEAPTTPLRTEQSTHPQTPEPAAAAAVVTPPEEEEEESLEPPALARTRSWRTKEFRKTFRHKAALRMNASQESDEAQRQPRRLVRHLVPTISEDEGVLEEGGVEEESLPEDSPAPPSPVKRLRDMFEANQTADESAFESTPTRSMIQESVEDENEETDENDENDTEEDAVSHRSMSEDEELPDDEEEATPPPIPPPEPAEWWTEMKERVDRYHRIIDARSPSVVSLASDGSEEDEEQLRKSFEDFAESQNQLGRAMAVALFRGMELGRKRPRKDAEREDAHARQVQQLKDQHERELRELRQQLMTKNGASGARAPSSVANTTARSEAFRQRFKSRLSSGSIVNNGDNNNNNSGPTGVFANDRTEVESAVSHMSCRELSVSRYRARILAQMNKGRAPSVAPSVSGTPLGGNNETLEQAPSEVSNESEGKQNAQEIQRLLDELQSAERRQKLLEKQLQQAGVVLAEDIPYQVAKDKVAAISMRMNEIGSSDVVHEDPLIQKQLREEYFRLEKDMQKYLSALMLTDEYAEEQRLEAEKWENKHRKANLAALEAIRKNMPVNIRTLTPDQLEHEQGVPKAMVQKFRRTNVLQLLRVDPAVVAKWHPSTVEAFRVTGLTLTERRAIHCYLESVASIWRGKAQGIAAGSADVMTNRKLAWHTTMKTNFQEALGRYERHLGGSNGVPRRHIQSTCLCNRCNLVGNQCPVRANRAIDYFGSELSFPTDGEGIYEDAKIVVRADSSDQKSPAEIIAAARGQPKESHVYESPIRPKAVVSKPAALRKKKAPKPSPVRPKHPLLAKGPSKPGGLLAAIAARRID